MTIDWILQFTGLTVWFVLAIMSAMDAWSDKWFDEARVPFILLMISIVLAYIWTVLQALSIWIIKRRLYHDPFRLAARKDDDEVIVKPSIND